MHLLAFLVFLGTSVCMCICVCVCVSVQMPGAFDKGVSLSDYELSFLIHDGESLLNEDKKQAEFSVECG